MENIERLISRANEIKSTDERTRFIMNYFFENVRYNYAYLFAKGYAQGTISMVSNNFKLAINKTKTNEDEEFSLTRSVIKGESKIHNEILQIRDRNSGNYSKFIEELRNYITRELNSHLGNKNIVSLNVESVIQKIEDGLREKKKVIIEGNECNVNYDISKVLIDFLLAPKKYFPPEFNNGIITSGVCEDYTDYLVPILKKAGIETYNVDGTSELGHAWVIVNSEDGYKSVDLTRAVFIRDGFLGIPAEQTSQDWLYADMKKIFEMQETRTITKINNITLPNPITHDNFDKKDFTNLMEKIAHGKVTDNTLKRILEQPLRDGVSKEECQKANASEQNAKDKEEQKYEH